MNPKINIPSLLKQINLWGANEIRSSSVVFLRGILAGVIIALIWSPTRSEFSNFSYAFFEDILNLQTKDFTSFFITIYKGNLIASFIVILLGLIHRYLSMAIVFGNGLLVGLVIFVIFFFEGLFLGTQRVITSLLPHGVFEIPAFLLAGAIAIRITKRSKGFKERFKILFNSKIAILALIVLLFIAALIESLLIVLVI